MNCNEVYESDFGITKITLQTAKYLSEMSYYYRIETEKIFNIFLEWEYLQKEKPGSVFRKEFIEFVVKKIHDKEVNNKMAKKIIKKMKLKPKPVK